MCGHIELGRFVVHPTVNVQSSEIVSEKEIQNCIAVACGYLEKIRNWKRECAESKPEGRGRVLGDKNIDE